MEYRAVGKRIAVDLDALELPFSKDRALELLHLRGFKILEVNLVQEARELVGKATYNYHAWPDHAPEAVNCSSFTRWVYGQRGVWIPRKTIQQNIAFPTIPKEEVRAGDLLFWTGAAKWYLQDPHQQIGHVAIATGEGTMVHASQRAKSVIETSINQVQREFRGARRVVQSDSTLLTLLVPDDTLIETSDDLRWFLLQRDAHEKRKHLKLARAA